MQKIYLIAILIKKKDNHHYLYKDLKREDAIENELFGKLFSYANKKSFPFLKI